MIRLMLNKIFKPKQTPGVCLGLLVGLLIWAGPLLAQEGQEVPGTTQEDGVDQQFEGFLLQGYSEEGEVEWDLKGDTADIVGSEVDITNVDAHHYKSPKVNITSQSGTINQTSGKMHLEKDVVITTEDGSRLTTDSLDWFRDEDLVTTKDPVKITGEGLMATGTGLEASPGLRHAEIREDVTVKIDTQPKAEERNTVTITSDGPMILDEAESVATFEDNVVAVQEGGRTLKADRLEIYFDQVKNQIQKMVCIGNVEILYGENETYAQRAVYDATTQKLTLSGRPKMILLTEGNDAFTALGN